MPMAGPASMNVLPSASAALPRRCPTVAQQCFEAVTRLGLNISPVNLMQAGLSRESMGSMIRGMVDEDLAAVFAEELPEYSPAHSLGLEKMKGVPSDTLEKLAAFSAPCM